MAQYNLGVCYYEGEGVERDFVKAFELFKKAAEKDVEGAQYNLAVMYEKGQGTKKDIKQAKYWYSRAARQEE